MKNKLVIISCCILGLLSLGAYLYPTEKEDIPTRILLENVGGKVIFDHKTHFEDYGVECSACHHESFNIELGVVECGVCHGSVESLGKPYPENVIAFEESGTDTKKPLGNQPFHNTDIVKDTNACLTCHHLEFTPKDWGHEMHYEDLGLSCDSCHHADTDIEPEPMNCNNCHDATTPTNLRDAVHVKCADCHQDLFDEGIEGCVTCHDTINTKQVYQEKGEITLNPTYMSCASCHEGAKPEDLIPNRMLAFHGQCIGCHESMGVPPYADDECAMCHIP